MKKSIYFFTVFCVCFFASTTLFAQKVTYTIYSGSDYYVYADYSITRGCQCTDSYSFSAWLNNFLTPLGASSKKSGKLTIKVGPKTNNNYLFAYKEEGKDQFIFNCAASCEYSASFTKRVRTNSIYGPYGGTATQDKDYIEITWKGNTDIPKGDHYYKVARDDPDNFITGKIVGVSTGSTQKFRDNNVGPNESHWYYIYTFTDKWGGHQSVAYSQSGSTRDRMLTASIGQARQISLVWDDISQATNKAVVRRDGVQIAEININSGADTAFADSDACRRR